MADISETVNDVPPITRYCSAVAICNSLALLASQGSLAIYTQRIVLLRKILRLWTKGKDVELSLMGCADFDSDDELFCLNQNDSEIANSHFESMKLEVEEAETISDRCLLEPVKEEIRENLLEDLQLMNDGTKQGDMRISPASCNSGTQEKTKSRCRKLSSVSFTDDANAETIAESMDAGTCEEKAESDNGKAEFNFICNECNLCLKTYAELKSHKNQKHTVPTVSEPICHMTDVVQADHHKTARPVKAKRKHDQAAFTSAKSKCVRQATNPFQDNDAALEAVQGLVKRKAMSNPRELVCQTCNKKFRMKCELLKHMSVHTGDKPFMCSVCGKRFRIKSMLTEHMKIHLGDKRHSCLQCGKSFVQASGLKDHLAVHSRTRTHVCTVCGQDFIRITLLNYHMRSHTGEKPYSCSICGKKFALPRQVRTHVMVHNDEYRFSCDVCSKKFKFKGGLNRHKRLHLEVKPFSCSVCTKTFTQAGNLRVHMRTHTGEKPYVCADCGQKFSHQPSLKKHREMSH